MITTLKKGREYFLIVPSDEKTTDKVLDELCDVIEKSLGITIIGRVGSTRVMEHEFIEVLDSTPKTRSKKVKKSTWWKKS